MFSRMKITIHYLLLCLLLAGFCWYHAPHITWKETVLINNMPTFADDFTAVEHRKHGIYGSEYGRMLQLRDGSWLAAYTISRNKGYQQDPEGGLELQISKSTDNGQSWTAISSLIDPGRDLDNAQMIQLDDGSILLGCRSVIWGESYHLPVYQSNDAGMHWSRLKNGHYSVVYEICGPEKCNVYYKTSEDGVTWSVGFGTMIPDQMGGPYILSVDDGRLFVTSNSSNISMSSDFGQSWQTVEAAWPESLWASLYHTGPDEICAMNSVPRPEGGHNVQIRFGSSDVNH